jgi:cyclopropane-fatty-acyl-phospholipid synthase
MRENLDPILEATESEDRKLYQKYELDEETERLAYHYEVAPEFFLTTTGGEWNTYSASIWEDGFTMTQAQEKKLDIYAEFMQLKPGDRILDVGCGWGGPLVYLCHKYGAIGHGITVSPMAIPVAEARAAKYGVDARFEVIHWQNMEQIEEFDAIFTDEVIVHFNDLDGFFGKCHSMLKPGGRMVNKELHFTHSSHEDWSDSLSQHINKVYAFTGNYRTLAQELQLLDDNNFRLSNLYEMDINHYRTTIDKAWLPNIAENKDRLLELTSEKYIHDFRKYLKASVFAFRKGAFGLHIVASHKM